MADVSPTEPITDAVHLAIDMQNIFAPDGIWANHHGFKTTLMQPSCLSRNVL